MDFDSDHPKNERQNDISSDEFRNRVLWLDVKFFSIATGLIFGILLFLATNLLVIKGGDVVGPHLQLLANYFIGYRVTFAGSLIGFGYGFISGCVIGGSISWIYNKVAARHGSFR